MGALLGAPIKSSIDRDDAGTDTGSSCEGVSSFVGKLNVKEVWKHSFAERRLCSRVLRVLTGGAPLEVRSKSVPATLRGRDAGPDSPPRRERIAPGAPSCEDSGGKRRADGLNERFEPTARSRISLPVEMGAAADSGRPSRVNRRRAARQSPPVDRFAPEK